MALRKENDIFVFISECHNFAFQDDITVISTDLSMKHAVFIKKNYHTTRPDYHGLLFWYLIKSDASVRYTLAYTEKVLFYKVLEQPCHEYLVIT